jgi:excinuclease ABC subunit C
MLRDDKSFPYVHFSAHEFPRLSFYRGSRKLPGRLFGPYPGASAVHETLNQLHKLFRIRSCKDTYFANRSRPCLEYQIGRCSAPCTGLISREAYARDVESAVLVLEGRAADVTERIGRDMDRAALQLDYERAAALRDQLAALTDIQSRQVVSRARTSADTDVIAVAEEGGEFCVALMFIRGGQLLGTSTFHPRAPISEAPDVLSAFVAQHYLERDPPPLHLPAVASQGTRNAAVAIRAIEAARYGSVCRRDSRSAGSDSRCRMRRNAAHAGCKPGKPFRTAWGPPRFS